MLEIKNISYEFKQKENACQSLPSVLFLLLSLGLLSFSGGFCRVKLSVSEINNDRRNDHC